MRQGLLCDGDGIQAVHPGNPGDDGHGLLAGTDDSVFIAVGTTNSNLQSAVVYVATGHCLGGKVGQRLEG